MTGCDNCGKECTNKYCCRRCADAFNARARRKKNSTTTYEDSCIKCGISIRPPRRKYCSKRCKATFLHKTDNYKAVKKYRSKSYKNYLAHLSYYKGRSELSVDFLVQLYETQKGLCAISGVPMTWDQGGGKSATNISIDRVDPAKGYKEDNVQLVCTIVNIMKLHYSQESLLWWCKQIINNNRQ